MAKLCDVADDCDVNVDWCDDEVLDEVSLKSSEGWENDVEEPDELTSCSEIGSLKWKRLNFISLSTGTGEVSPGPGTKGSVNSTGGESCQNRDH